MDFDNGKVYGDTSITDGLVLFDIDPPGAGEHGLVASWLLLSHSWLCSALQHVGLGLPGSFIFSHLYYTLDVISFSTEGAFSSVIGRFPSSYMGAMMQVQGTIHLAPCKYNVNCICTGAYHTCMDLCIYNRCDDAGARYNT